MTTLLPVLALGFNALVWGLSWWPLKTLESQGLHPLWATAIIFAVSLACVLLWRPQAWRGLLKHPALWFLLLASGLIVGESLVGVALAAAIGLSGKEAPLALGGPDFCVTAQWLGLAAFIVVCLAFRRRVLAAR